MATQLPEFLQSIDAALGVGTPLINVSSADQIDCIQTICEMLVLKAQAKKRPAPVMVMWDSVTGFRPIMPKKIAPETYGYLSKLIGQPFEEVKDQEKVSKISSKPLDMLRLAVSMPTQIRLFAINTHRILDDRVDNGGMIAQGFWNLRELFKQDARCCFLMSPASMRLPQQLIHDVLVIEEPYPDRDTRARVFDSSLQSFNEGQVNGGQKPISIEPKLIERAVDITSGLSAFALEQSLSMNYSANAPYINIGALRKRKIQYIQNSQGVSVWPGKEAFADLKDQDNWQNFCRNLLDGRDPPKCIVLWDEAEKTGGATADAGDSGTSQEMNGTFLSWMQDKDVPGIIILGPGGGGKTAGVKGFANEGQRDLIIINPAEMKSKYVGSSVENLRNGLNIIEAVSDGRAVICFTCNQFNFSPEMQRRCYLGKWFFDLPSKEGRAAIWDVYRKKYNLEGCQIPEDEGWTGAEIRACALIAWRFEAQYRKEKKEPLIEAAKKIIPVATSAAEKIEDLRTTASGRFISSAYDGVYKYNKINEKLTEGLIRKRQIDALSN